MFEEDPGSVKKGKADPIMQYIRAWRPTFIYVSPLPSHKRDREKSRGHRLRSRQKEFMPQLEQWGLYVPGRVGGYFRDVQTWKKVRGQSPSPSQYPLFIHTFGQRYALQIAMDVVGKVRVNGTKTPFLSNVLSNQDAYLGRPLNDSELGEECMGGM